MTTQTVLGATADSLARLYTAEAMGLLVQVVRGDVEAKTSERIRAAEDILDRGHGRAVQAVISVPARQAVAARLAAMSDDALLQIAQRGSRERNEGPVPPGASAGSHPEQEGIVPGTTRDSFADYDSSMGYRSDATGEGAEEEYEPPSDVNGPVRLPAPRAKPSANRNTPASLRDADITDAEIEVDPLT